MKLDRITLAYFIGIGGIGMSALARYFNARSVQVSGYDRTATPLTRELEGEGMQIHYEPKPEELPEGEDVLFVYTPAVPTDFPELAVLRERNTQVYKRAEVLGLISQDRRCIGIAGTHGKTTTTTLTTKLLSTAELQPSAFLGGIAKDFDGNYVHGQSDLVVVEADEYDRSFLQLQPEIAVILSIDPDHLDIYGDHGKMLDSGFRAYAKQVKEDGLLLVRHDLADQIGDHQARQLTFGLGAGDYNAHNLRVVEGAFEFDLKTSAGGGIPRMPTSRATASSRSSGMDTASVGGELKIGNKDGIIRGLRLPLPGRHNVENATAAAAVALELGAAPESVKAGLATFSGISRRFEIRLHNKETVIVDDYAHHPTELEATISAAREFYPDRTIRGVFQPHLYSRTRDFAEGFAKALSELDEVILLPIYPARELPMVGVDSRLIFDKISGTKKRLLDKEDLLNVLPQLREGVLLLMGAGDIDALVDPIVNQFKTLS
ncbi:MAG: UDP-N-acetylmuramate--L-alanine ligase [Bacteroidota bacterium]